jgi:TP901 family phage tail tape measure protein
MNFPGLTSKAGIIGSAWVELGVLDQPFHKGMSSAHKVTKGFGDAAPKLLRGATIALAGMGAAAVTAAGALTALAVKGTRDYAEFGHEMATVSTMIRQNVEENTAVLSRGVRQLSLDIPQSTSLLTTALYDILSASVPVADSMNVLGLSGKAAVAGVSDVQTAANLATGTINAMGLSFSDTNKVFDIAFSTVRSGKITFTELAGAMGQLLPSASKMNASIEEVYGSIAFLTKNAMSADMASISLARAFDAMGQKADKLEGMGIRVFGEEGQYVGIVNVMEQIAGKLAGLTDEAKVAKLEMMGFEARAARAVNVMVNNMEAFKQTMSEVSDSAGAMGEAYGRMKDTIVNQWSILKNTVKDLSISIGEEFAGSASSAIIYMTDMVKSINALIVGSGGLNEMWSAHGDVLLSAFGQITAGIVNLMGEGVKGMGAILKEFARRPVEDFVRSFYEGFSKIGDTFTAVGKSLIGKGEGVFTELERLRKEDEARWDGYKADQDERMAGILSGIAQSAIQAGTDMRNSLGAAKAELKSEAEAVKNIAIDTADKRISSEKLVTTATQVQAGNRVRISQVEANQILEALSDLYLNRTRLTNLDYDKFLESQRNRVRDAIEANAKIKADEEQAAIDNLKILSELNVGRRKIVDKSYEHFLTSQQDRSKLAKEYENKRQEDIEAAWQEEQQKLQERDLYYAKMRESDLDQQQAWANQTVGDLNAVDWEYIESYKMRLDAAKTHWTEYMSITDSGITAIANSYIGLYELFNNTDMSMEQVRSKSIVKFADWINKQITLINDLVNVWKSASRRWRRHTRRHRRRIKRRLGQSRWSDGQGRRRGSRA